jgi:hypothetical protein
MVNFLIQFLFTLLAALLPGSHRKIALQPVRIPRTSHTRSSFETVSQTPNRLTRRY